MGLFVHLSKGPTVCGALSSADRTLWRLVGGGGFFLHTPPLEPKWLRTALPWWVQGPIGMLHVGSARLKGPIAALDSGISTPPEC